MAGEGGPALRCRWQKECPPLGWPGGNGLRGQLLPRLSVTLIGKEGGTVNPNFRLTHILVVRGPKGSFVFICLRLEKMHN